MNELGKRREMHGKEAERQKGRYCYKYMILKEVQRSAEQIKRLKIED